MIKFVAFFLLAVAPLLGESAALYDPIALYLTWQRDPTTTMSIQWITPPDLQEDLVQYQTVGETEWRRGVGFHLPMPEKYPYLIHHLELTSLIPDTTYNFRIGTNGVSYQFRTMPSFPVSPIRFVVGGDIYHGSWETLKLMNSQVAKLDPQFILIGGDLVYNEKSAKKFKNMPRWLEWLIAWKQQMVTSKGRLIPLLPAIGNHDVEKAPYFFSLFPFPGVNGYGVLDFGKYLSIIFLDTEHTKPIPGEQTEWLSETLRCRQQISHRLALYHVPAYPCVRDFNNEVSFSIRKHWVPIFEKYHLHTAFENHDHAYKRTPLIRNGKPDPQGVMYLGDGGWGVDKPRQPQAANKTWFLAKSVASRNIVLMVLYENRRHLTAYDEKGRVIDEYFDSRNSEQFQPLEDKLQIFSPRFESPALTPN